MEHPDPDLQALDSQTGGRAPATAAGREWLAAAYPKPTKHNRPEREQMRVWLIRVEAEAADLRVREADAAALALLDDLAKTARVAWLVMPDDQPVTQQLADRLDQVAGFLRQPPPDLARPSAPAEPEERGAHPSSRRITQSEGKAGRRPAAAEGPEPTDLITTEGTPAEHAHARAMGRAYAAGQSAGALRAALDLLDENTDALAGWVREREGDKAADRIIEEWKQVRAALAAKPEAGE